MSVITRISDPNIWDIICKEYASQKPPFQGDRESSIHTDYEDFDPSRHNPVFFGKMHERVNVDGEPFEEVDITIGHTSCAGYAFVEKPSPPPPKSPPPPPNKDTCSPREYLEHNVFPILLPALEEMLKEAKREKCFERKRTKFNALDFLTEYLWGRNPNCSGREGTPLLEIPFVKEWLKEHSMFSNDGEQDSSIIPRPPLPLSLIWTEAEAALVIQSHWRGYLVRRQPDIQELRVWQREWREENQNISHRVSDFWAKQMPEGQTSPNSVDILVNTEPCPTETVGQLTDSTNTDDQTEAVTNTDPQEITKT